MATPIQRLSFCTLSDRSFGEPLSGSTGRLFGLFGALGGVEGGDRDGKFPFKAIGM